MMKMSGIVVVLCWMLIALPFVISNCPNDCYSQWEQGDCVDNTCQCNSQFMGDDCGVNYDSTFDWDNIVCQNGGRFYPPNFYYGWVRYCVCPPGYAGVDCTICASDLGCEHLNTANTTYKCDNTMYPQSKKYYNCTIMEPDLTHLLKNSQGVATAYCEFPVNLTTNGLCSMNFYVRQTGVPLLFSCNFTQCSTSVDYLGTNTIACDHTHCNGTSFYDPVTQAAELATSTMSLKCNQNGACVWTQAEFAVNLIPQIHLQCGAGECIEHDIAYVKMPPTEYKRLILVIAIGLGVLLLSVFTSIGAYAVLRLTKVYNPLPHVEATLSFQNISCSIKQKDGTDRVILHEISGSMLPGRVTAIMGSSGAGKTTFLDILAGRKNTGSVNGTISINGEPRNKSFKRLVGYVTQDDVFMGTLTVREHLRYVAQLRLPAHMPDEDKMKRVEDCMNDLGILHIANSRIGTNTSRGISGGERKRLAIAAELVVDPSVLLLDEPTSGLDSHSASSLVMTLQNLAHGKKSRTIVMSIHQPRSDIFQMFDHLLVFANGFAVYHGEACHALSYFADLGYECPPNFNPADFIIDTVANPDFAKAIKPMKQTTIVNTDGHNANSDVDLNEVDEYASSFFTQFNVLTHRTFLNAFRNPFLLRVQYILYILVAVVLGFLYHGLSKDLLHGGFQNRMGSLFFIVTLLSFGALTSIDLFFSERLLFLRERATGCYRTSAYFLSKAVSDLLPMRILPPIILGSIVYYWIGYQPIFYKFLIFLFALVLISMTATSLCFVISSLSPTIAVGNLIAILLLFFFLLFGGFLVNINNMPDSVRWITNLSYLTFGYSILMVNEFNGISIDINPAGINTHTVVAGSVLLEQVGMSINDMGKYMIGLVSMLGLFLLVAYLALRFVVKERR